MKLKLYHYWRSSSSWRVRWALNIKGLSCEYIALNLLSDEAESPEHLKRNPLGYVPVLEVLDEPTSRVQFLAASTAIIEWLDEVYPSPLLIFGDAYQKAQIRQLSQIINADTQPLQNLNAMHKHSTDPQEQKNWNRYWIENGLRAYEKVVAASVGKFSVGDTLSCADLFLVPQCYNALRYEIPLDQFPNIQKIYSNALALESAQTSAPDRFQP